MKSTNKKIFPRLASMNSRTENYSQDLTDQNEDFLISVITIQK